MAYFVNFSMPPEMPAHDDEAGQREEDDAVDDGLRLVREQTVEEVARGEAAAAPGGAEDVAEVDDYVLRDVAAEDGVEAHDEEGGGYAQPAEPAHFLGELFVGADDAEAGLASQRQLAHHDDEADEQHQQQIHYQKCKAAVGAHLVREAPQVAEADRRADRGHEEAEIAPQFPRLCSMFFPPFKSLPTGFSTPGKAIIKEEIRSFNRDGHILSLSLCPCVHP